MKKIKEAIFMVIVVVLIGTVNSDGVLSNAHPRGTVRAKPQEILREIGDYSFGYKTLDGVQRSENGHIENQGENTEELVVKGMYSFFDSEGIEYLFRYVADNKGFRPIIDVYNKNRGVKKDIVPRT